MIMSYTYIPLFPDSLFLHMTISPTQISEVADIYGFVAENLGATWI